MTSPAKKSPGWIRDSIVCGSICSVLTPAVGHSGLLYGFSPSDSQGESLDRDDQAPARLSLQLTDLHIAVALGEVAEYTCELSRHEFREDAGHGLVWMGLDTRLELPVELGLVQSVSDIEAQAIPGLPSASSSATSRLRSRTAGPPMPSCVKSMGPTIVMRRVPTAACIFTWAGKTPARSPTQLSRVTSGTRAGFGGMIVCPNAAAKRKPSPREPVWGHVTPPVAMMTHFARMGSALVWTSKP